MPPPNTTPGTAEDLGTLPVTITPLDVSTASAPDFEVWYKYTAVDPEIIIGIYAHTDAPSAYIPELTVWTGTPPGVVQYLTTIDTFNTPAQVPVTAGTTYYFKIQQQDSGVTPDTLLQLTAQTGPGVGVNTNGKRLLITDADVGFPAAVITPGTDGVSSFQTLTAADWGARLPSGYLGFQDRAVLTQLLIYNPLYELTETVAAQFNNQQTLQQVAASQTYFYTGKSTAIAAATIHQVASDGTVGSTVWTLPANSMSLRALGPNTDDTVLYYTALGSAAVRAWDLVNSTALPDLVATRAGYSVLHDLVVLTDGTILCPFAKAGSDVVERYNSSGTLLNTYSLPSAMELDRISIDPSSAETFWAWCYQTSDQFYSSIFQIQVSDGSVLSTTNVPIFLGGVYQDDTDTDPPSFGTSNTCPLLVIPGTTTETFPIRRQRRFLLPSSPDNKRMQIPVIELLLRTGIGLTPDAWGSDANVPQGANPQVMIRLSKDGGKTWGAERWLSAGKIGQYLRRVRLLRATGNYRNAVLEVTVSDPVDWQFLAAMAPNGITEGSS